MPDTEVVQQDPVADAPAPVTPIATSEQVDATPPAPKPQEVELTADQQRAFDKRLGKELAKLRRENDERLAETLRNLQTGRPPAPAVEQTDDDLPPYPEMANFATWEEGQKAQKEWTIHAIKHTKASAIAEFQAAQAQRATNDKWASSVAETKAQYEDYEEHVRSIDDLIRKVPEHVTDALTRLSNPAAFLYLMTRDELEGLIESDPRDALMAIGEIRARISASPRDADPDNPPARPAPPVRQAAPAPIRPVKKPAPTATGLSDDDSIDVWLRKRNAQLNKK